MMIIIIMNLSFLDFILLFLFRIISHFYCNSIGTMGYNNDISSLLMIMVPRKVLRELSKSPAAEQEYLSFHLEKECHQQMK